jgi:hypothetical protein
VKFPAAREHIDNPLYALDLGLSALCGLQPVCYRIQIGLVERSVELADPHAQHLSWTNYFSPCAA